MLRTALALGALAVSVPLLAQNGRYGFDRSRVERNGDGRGNRQDDKKDKNDRRGAPRSEDRSNARPAPSVADRGSGRIEARVGGGVFRGWGDRRDGDDRRNDARVMVRPPVVIDRYDRRDGGRYEPREERRYGPPGHAYGHYRYGDRDFRTRDVFAITAWFRTLPPARLTAYGYYGPGYGGVRYAFRPGLYLSLGVFMQLTPLPYDLELELGELPWYLERRIYGNTVLVIDTRTRMVVDMYEIDY